MTAINHAHGALRPSARSAAIAERRAAHPRPALPTFGLVDRIDVILPVLDEAQHVIGWLTLSDLSRHLLVRSEVVQNALRDITDKVTAQ